ncbi:hypothetical protein [Piscirickettsia litoralis]|nr:hypothetical protein [Piscirickettsia litoralis]
MAIGDLYSGQEGSEASRVKGELPAKCSRVAWESGMKNPMLLLCDQ